MPNLGKFSLTWILEKNTEMWNHEVFKNNNFHINYSPPKINEYLLEY